jgi:acetoin utilization deacetylase AcuC-like enzyme
MILFIPSARPALTDFGISIPSAPGRAGRVLAELRRDAALASREGEWLVGPRGIAMSREDLLRAHDAAYVERLFSDEVEEVLRQVYELVDDAGNFHRYDPSKARRPLRELFDPGLASLAGSYQVCLEALDRGFCFYFGGGAHHAHPGFGHGFCILNDSAIALRRLQSEKRIRTAWVIDVDAHKGDGTAEIFRSDPTVVTLSVHTARGWPLDGPEVLPDGRENPAWIPSDIDVPIERGEEGEYVNRLASALESLERDFGVSKPDLALVLLGADPYEHDELPSTSLLRLSLDRMGERDRLIYEFLAARDIPQAYLMAGGYGERAWEPYPPFLSYVLHRRLEI